MISAIAGFANRILSRPVRVLAGCRGDSGLLAVHLWLKTVGAQGQQAPTPTKQDSATGRALYRSVHPTLCGPCS